MVKVVVATALFVLLATGAAFGSLSEETPVEFANRFYHTYGALRVRGLPNEQQRRALAPFLTAELRELLARANRRLGPASSIRPPPGKTDCKCEGDLFTSNTIGCANTYAIGFPHPAIGRLILPIHLADDETGDTWVDQLILHHSNGHWFIAEIVFTNEPQNRLCGKGSLRRVLEGCLRK
jgi:hypothetical protein